MADIAKIVARKIVLNVKKTPNVEVTVIYELNRVAQEERIRLSITFANGGTEQVDFNLHYTREKNRIRNLVDLKEFYETFLVPLYEATRDS